MHHRRLLEQRHPVVTPYEQHRGYVLAVLACQCGWLDPGEREVAFQDACVVMLEKDRDGRLEVDRMNTHRLRAYLTQTALNKVLDAGKLAERTRTVALTDAALAQPDPGASVEELVAAEMEALPVREIIAELAPRQRQIIWLRHSLDRTPEETQRLLGIGERVYRRELERAVGQLAERYDVVRSGRWCEGRRSLILAYVLGIAGPNRVRDARSHISSCPGCARVAANLRTALRDPTVQPALPASPREGLVTS